MTAGMWVALAWLTVLAVAIIWHLRGIQDRLDEIALTLRLRDQSGRRER